jgi:fructose-bisphosphate aldolase class I
MVDLAGTAAQMMAPGKGLLAADESNKSADARLKLFGIPVGEEYRRKDRELFLDTPGIEEFLSGVILYDETLHEKADSCLPFAELLTKKGIIPGIKVDLGLEPFPESADESITSGLIGLPERLVAYNQDYGTGFTKWRAVVKIDGDRLPTAQAILENAKRLATYAKEAQAAGMVPILEPEVLLEGNHSRLRCKEVLVSTLETLMSALLDQAVDISAIILKTAMVVSGKDAGRLDTPEEVAESTVDALMMTIPSAVPGIVFLSGGQTPDQATENLRAIVRKGKDCHAPWPMTFSYARALQEEALAVWSGKDENMPAARAVFLERLKKVSDAATI